MATADRAARVPGGARHLDKIRPDARWAAGAALVVALLAAGAFISLWPGFTLVALAVSAVLVLARLRPAYAFLLAVVLFAFEGSVKTMLVDGGAPLPVSGHALAAVLLDLTLAVAVAAVVLEHRRTVAAARVSRDQLVAVLVGVWLVGSLAQGVLRRDPAALALNLVLGSVLVFLVLRSTDVAAARQLVRKPVVLVTAALGAWIVVSLVQALSSADVELGLAAFRLIPAYALVLVGAVFLPLDEYLGGERAKIALIGLALVAGYAAFRTVFGPLEVESAYVLTRGQPIAPLPWTVGSFSGQLALVSFLVPATVFSLTLAALDSRFRKLGLLIAAASTLAIAGSHIRTSAAGLLAGFAIAAVLFVERRLHGRRRRLAATAAVATLLVLAAAALAAAVAASPALRERAEARLGAWRGAATTVVTQPLGAGAGVLTVGRPRFEPAPFLESSYVKALHEQGVLGVLFLVAVLAASALSVERLVRQRVRGSPVVTAAAAAFLSFAALALVGPYFDQPGKVLAWALFGLVLGAAHTRARAEARRA